NIIHFRYLLLPGGSGVGTIPRNGAIASNTCPHMHGALGYDSDLDSEEEESSVVYVKLMIMQLSIMVKENKDDSLSWVLHSELRRLSRLFMDVVIGRFIYELQFWVEENIDEINPEPMDMDYTGFGEDDKNKQKFGMLTQAGRWFQDLLIKADKRNLMNLWTQTPVGHAGGILMGIDLDVFDIGAIDEGDFYMVLAGCFGMGSTIYELNQKISSKLKNGEQIIEGDANLKKHITNYYKGLKAIFQMEHNKLPLYSLNFGTIIFICLLNLHRKKQSGVILKIDFEKAAKEDGQFDGIIPHLRIVTFNCLGLEDWMINENKIEKNDVYVVTLISSQDLGREDKLDSWKIDTVANVFETIPLNISFQRALVGHNLVSWHSL
ncbi:hypothetical protein ACJX0J_019615, partial [Zea mays]